MRLMAKPTLTSHAALVKRDLRSGVRENVIIEPGDEVGQVVGKIACREQLGGAAIARKKSRSTLRRPALIVGAKS
jgi:hypothetical protein